MNKLTAYVVLASLALSAITGASASLVPTSFGFPVMIQNATTSAFNRDWAGARDLESMTIDFHTFGPSTGSFSSGTTAFGSTGFAFPHIRQDSLQEQTAMHTDFAQNTELAVFSYPYAGTGPMVLPGFNFGF